MSVVAADPNSETPKPTWKGAVLAILLGSVGIGLFSEAVLRFIVPRFDRFTASDRVVLFPRYVQDVRYGDYRIRQNVPNSRYFHTSVDGSWEFRINAQGFRADRDFAIEKPAGTVRIATLGDSMTAGYEARQEHIYPAIIERYLQRQGIHAEVLNAGVSGFSTAEELVVLEHYLLQFHLDFVVLAFFQNDYDDNVKTGLFALENGEIVATSHSHVPGIRIANFLYRYTPHAWLNEHSWAYTYLFNAVYDLAKAGLGRASLRKLQESHVLAGAEVARYQNDLALSLLRRIYEICQEREIRFILIDIPTQQLGPSLPEEVRRSPGAYADVIVDGSETLGDYFGVVDVFVPHGQRHLSEVGHLALGIEAAKWIEGSERLRIAAGR
jgi:hypothetical protein